mgnify:CR=1 FL=1
MQKFYAIYRKGAAGALLHIYEQAIAELSELIAAIPDQALTVIIDPETSNEDCRSFQAILSHTVHAGFGYAVSIHQLKEKAVKRPEKVVRLTIRDYIKDLQQVIAYTEEVMSGIQDDELEQFDNALKIRTSWGQLYDIEQMMEHAIVHILRHKRQIEKFRFSGWIPVVRA